VRRFEKGIELYKKAVLNTLSCFYNMPLCVDSVKEIHAGSPWTLFGNISPLKEELKRTKEWKEKETEITGNFKEALLYLHEFAKAKGIPRFSFWTEAVRDDNVSLMALLNSVDRAKPSSPPPKMEEEITATIDSLLDFIFGVPYGGSMEQSARDKILEQFCKQVAKYKEEYKEHFKKIPLLKIVGIIFGGLGTIAGIIFGVLELLGK
jgi:hypothetical protein